MLIMVRISRPAPTSSTSVRAVCAIVTARSSRRSPRPAVDLGPAPFSTSFGSRREARQAGMRPARVAAMRARPSPKSRTGQPVVTASSRGMACPPISWNARTAPNARPAPSAPPARASSRLSVEAWRKSPARPTPRAARTAYSRWRPRPRRRSSAATLPQAIKSTSAEAPNSGRRMRSPSRLNSEVSDWTLGVKPAKSGSAWACRAVRRASSACACSSV